MKLKRKIEIKTESGWKKIPFKDLRMGNIFRVSDQVFWFLYSCDNHRYICLCQPYYNKNGILTVATIDKIK
jgi:hypothetical protein